MRPDAWVGRRAIVREDVLETPASPRRSGNFVPLPLAPAVAADQSRSPAPADIIVGQRRSLGLGVH